MAAMIASWVKAVVPLYFVRYCNKICCLLEPLMALARAAVQTGRVG